MFLNLCLQSVEVKYLQRDKILRDYQQKEFKAQVAKRKRIKNDSDI